MKSEGKRARRKQIVSWVVLGIFIAGFFPGPVGVWTGPVLGAWLIGTQRVRRGFVWLLLLTFVPMLLWGLREVPLRAPVQGLERVGWMLAASLMMVLPFVFYRVVRAHLAGVLQTGLMETLSLPVAGVVVKMAALRWLPAQVTGLAFHGTALTPVLAAVNADFGTAAVTFMVLWFAATVVWMWSRSFARRGSPWGWRVSRLCI